MLSVFVLRNRDMCGEPMSASRHGTNEKKILIQPEGIVDEDSKPSLYA